MFFHFISIVLIHWTLFFILSQFRLILAEDGSGKGAGLTAAIALGLQRKRKLSCA